MCRADGTGAEDDLSLHVLVLVVVCRVAAADVDEIGGDVRAVAAGGQRRRDVTKTGDQLRRPRLSDPQLGHFAGPLLRAKREALDVHVAEAVLLRLGLGVLRFAVRALIFVGGPVPFVRAHLHHVMERLRTRQLVGDGVERGLREKGLRIRLFLRQGGRRDEQKSGNNP